MKRVRVAVGRNPYEVVIGRGAVSSPALSRALGPGASGVIVSSRAVMNLHGGALLPALGRAGFSSRRIILLPDGEKAKTTGAWETSVRAMARAGLDRSSFVIAFGGGSIGDAAGFAAATFQRGVRFVQIPTTLLAMVDSSVGGKTGINLPAGKNLVGAFHQPALVLADLAFLRTLPPRERQSGVYEILKCGLLRSGGLTALVERTRGLRNATEAETEAAIAGSVRIKARIVEADERESGERILLNLGHTLGHALEAATSYRGFSHGEAVGYGLDFAVDLSAELGLSSPEDASRMRTTIEAVGPRTPLRARLAGAVRRSSMSDKKRDGAGLKEVLLGGPQRPVVHRMDARDFAKRAALWVTRRAGRRA